MPLLMRAARRQGMFRPWPTLTASRWTKRRSVGPSSRRIVVNNAGFGLLGPAAKLDRAEQLAMIDLNVRALTELSLRFVDSLARHRGGILNVASIASFLPGPGMAVYHATKAYVLSFSEALHHELARQGVRVTALCPGPVETEFQARAGLQTDNLRILTLPARQVARTGYRSFTRGERVVVAGTATGIVASLLRLVPHAVLLSLADQRRWSIRQQVLTDGNVSTHPPIVGARRGSQVLTWCYGLGWCGTDAGWRGLYAQALFPNRMAAVMAKCKTCGNDYDKAFQVSMNGGPHFRCFECAIHALAPTCANCGIHIVGHGLKRKAHFLLRALRRGQRRDRPARPIGAGGVIEMGSRT